MRMILLAGALGLIGTLLGTRLAIHVLVLKGYGQYVRDDGPKEHLKKAGTPTMGGIAIIASVVLSYALAHLFTWTPPTASGMLLLGLFAGLGFVGFLDDWIKISRARSLGLNSRAKLALQTLVATLFAIGCFAFPNSRGVTPASQYVSFLRDLQWFHLPLAVAILWIIFIIAALSNGVNLSDGLDGLATGLTTMVFAAYAVVNLWQSSQSCASLSTAGPQCYEVRDPIDLAAVSLALAGACFGFLWWNASPAKIFMGDSGSLALGGAVAGLAILTRTELLVVVLGGMFVLITLSVVAQVGYFKLSGGKRLFKMAPLHHHFEMKGWAEQTVVVRFWIICGIFIATGMGLFYAEWVVAG
ncbi:MAG TPA: phospho-N-acetylmuramoyl-pentapeptide-transferase [Propioniciclava sp.]|uniref:phospho-N-acetylmuramoyl-pentapeptide- transferase n=1 Tax=Propioniciclava sp. TaxID=2038686 RepID=UPI002D14A293|nr:phospho-N-acetylmuramoyl-pentapeptide-transferase [Propioniciclava sp.]HRL48790.1 phospho-N-acetylmuramoyl-pentapeptide-transferase [Propioniciclava sp.]HRL78809.1 phospho-N-acetylmuramoyl-pentapeptide-transferase [Propioniciclava sp.]